MAHTQLACTILPILSILLFTFLLLNSSCEAATRDAEKEALLSLERDWGKPVTLNWSSINTDQCNWPGIICGDGFVTGFSLAGFNLYKPIPSAICSFKNLVYINLSNNGILGSFPTVLFNCSSLQHLDLSNNALVGFLPSNIHLLSKRLVYLNLASNYLSNSIPSSIGQLHGLRFLHLGGNCFNGSYPVELENLTNLEALNLDNNQFAPDRIHQRFGNLTNLQYLWLSNINIIGEIPDSLSALTKLRLIDLSFNKLSGTIPNWIWSLKNLEILHLYENCFHGQISKTVHARNLAEISISTNLLTGQIPEDFGKLNNLTLLSLCCNQLSGSIPKSIGLLPMLRDVQLSQNSLSGVLPKELGTHSMLSHLDLSDNNFSGELPTSLASCRSLQTINLERNHFTGRFPVGMWSLPKVTTIMVYDNSLTGSLPSELGPSIARIDISNNRFSGRLPTSANNLTSFRASNNSISGEIPANLIDHALLQDLVLDQNMLSGLLPSRIWYLASLSLLDLSRNNISGEIPDTIGKPMSIFTIDLSQNNLYGPIPLKLAQLKPYFLNLSSNQLTGQIPLPFQTETYKQSFLSNPGLCSSDHFANLPRCHLRRPLIILLVLGSTILMCTCVYGFNKVRTFLTRQRDNCKPQQWKLTTFHSINFNVQDILHGITHGNLVGSGGSGKVYRICLDNSTCKVIAVKKIWNGLREHDIVERQFQAEIKTLGTIRHANIVKLLGCISSSETKLLIYEYMEQGSLYDWLHKKDLTSTTEQLNWPMRISIAIDAARGLSYMHHDCSPPIAHRDVKSSNILLDLEFKAKIADFGLARELVKAGEPESISAMVGSFGYMAPEFGSIRKINVKVDVYSFGVVLLELITGRRATGEGGGHENLAQWAWRKFQEEGFQLMDVVDENIRDASSFHEVQLVFKLGLICTGTKPSLRPTMKEVLQVLQR